MNPRLVSRLLALAVAALFLYISSSFVLPVIMGAVVAVLILPVMERLEHLHLPIRVPTVVTALLLTILIGLLVLAPSGALVFLGAKSGFQQIQHLRMSMMGHPSSAALTGQGGDWIDALISTPLVKHIFDWISRYFPSSVSSIEESTHDLVQNVALKLADWLGQFIAALPGMVLALVVTTVSIFFFLLDGRRLVLFFRRNTIFTPAQTEELIHSMAGMCRSVILASVVSGLVQALVMFAAGFILGVPDTPLIAGLVFMGSFIPVVGSAPVTLGATLQQFIVAGSTHGIAMLVVVAIIAGVDNLVRPLFLRGSANLHPLLAFIAAFGGLQTFGFIGVFLGPIIAGLLVSLIHVMTAERTPTVAGM